MKRTINNIIFSILDVLIINFEIFLSTVISKLSLKFQGCEYGRSFKTSGKCYFKAYKSKSILLGDNIFLNSAYRTNRIGLTNPTSIETLADGKILIGDYSGCSSVVLSSRTKIQIGRRVKIGANTKILDHDFHSLDHKKRKSDLDNKFIKSEPIKIDDDVFIGANVIILKGVHIGSRTIIGANSVLTMKEIPSDVIVAGNPAKIIRKIDNE